MDETKIRRKRRTPRRKGDGNRTTARENDGAWQSAWGPPKGGVEEPFINNLPVYNILSEDKLEAVHEASVHILERIGITFSGDPEALELWKAAGAEIDGENVKIPRELIDQLMSNAPEEFVQHAKNPLRSVKFGKNHMVFSPIFASPYVRDLENRRRSATLADMHDLIRLTHLSSRLNYGGAQTCEPMDIPAPKRHLEMVRGHLTLSEKPFMGDARSQWRAQDSLQMCEIVFGEKFVREHVVLLGLVTVASPRLWDASMLETLEYYARMGQALLIVPFIMQGANTPVTIAGALAQANAEALAGMAYSQLVRPGTPVIYGCSLATVSMKSGAPLYGTSEIARLTLAMGQLARRYKVPYRIGGGRNGAMESDMNAGTQNAMTMMPAIMAHANYILHSVGWLESSMSVSFAQFILDLDQLALLQEFARNIDIDEESLAVEAISEVRPGGDYFSNAHTVKHYRTAFVEPMLPVWGSYEAYVEAGSPKMVDSALQWARRALDAYEQPELEISVKDQLDDFVTRRMAELPNIET
ncbi:MAG: trimethylamine methyltransferase family protein [Gammaproteobacteria bacterium]|nr:trimethylamine methyltransferase family protein [Gammaproteobacteria bacterium]